MAVPAQSKTWQFNVNQSMAATGTVIGNMRAILRTIKNSMTAFGTLPWTVSGSSDATTSGMDGTDRWSADNKLIWSGTVAFSWIVLRQTGVAAKYEILIALNITNANGAQLSAYMSSSAGFGVANGGTDGSTTTRPTATDEVTLLSGIWADNTGGNLSYKLHVQQSTDGQCTRALLCTSGKTVSFWLFDKPANPISAWTHPAIGCVAGSANSAASICLYTQFNDTALIGFRQGSTNGTLFCATTFNALSCIGEQLSVANDLSSDWGFYPITFVSATVGLRGKWGEVFDLYWGQSTGLTGGDQYDGSGSKTWTYFECFNIPWDGSTTALLT
jgi:hypothetical protein